MITGDVDDFGTRLDRRFDASEARILSRFESLIRDFEAHVLEAFYVYAETSQRRLTIVEREISALKDGVAIVESRLTEVEKRLNMPPAA